MRTLVTRVLGVHTDERAWRRRSRRAHPCRRARQGWRGLVLVHDVTVGTRDANIDHVIVGPGGVFTVNPKYHAGKSVWVGGDTVLIDGHRQPYVRNARHEAARASKLLPAAYGQHVPVTGIVAVLTQSWTSKAARRRRRPRSAAQRGSAPRAGPDIPLGPARDGPTAVAGTPERHLAAQRLKSAAFRAGRVTALLDRPATGVAGVSHPGVQQVVHVRHHGRRDCPGQAW